MENISDKELIDELKKRLAGVIKTEKEIQFLQKELKEVNQKLTESEQIKSHFISNISNEIVNPFTSILALSKNILEVEKENWKKVVSMVALIHSEAFNLDFQLKNIIAAAKLEAGDVYPEISKVEIKGLLLDIIDAFKYEAKKKHLEVKLLFNIDDSKGAFYFKTDSEKIRLILSNLISNAIKFSFVNENIVIDVNKDNNQLIIMVQDFGQGISVKNQEIIFDRFKRLDTGINSINRGHGLGLSVNKAMIEILNGAISVNSTIGKGALFIVKIPESDAESNSIMLNGNEMIFREDTY